MSNPAVNYKTILSPEDIETRQAIARAFVDKAMEAMDAWVRGDIREMATHLGHLDDRSSTMAELVMKAAVHGKDYHLIADLAGEDVEVVTRTLQAQDSVKEALKSVKDHLKDAKEKSDAGQSSTDPLLDAIQGLKGLLVTIQEAKKR